MGVPEKTLERGHGTEFDVVYTHQHRAVQVLMRRGFFLPSLIKSYKNICLQDAGMVCTGHSCFV